MSPRELDLHGALPTGTWLLEASAGTGKTYAIAHLAMRMLAESPRLRLEQLLVVTFTRAAAAELRERIRARIRDGLDMLEASASPPGSVDENLSEWARRIDEGGQRSTCAARLRYALESFDAAQIGTIDSFCHRIASRHAFETGLDLGLEVGAPSSRLVREIALDVLGRAIDAAPWSLVGARSQAWPVERILEMATKLADSPEASLVPLADATVDPALAFEHFDAVLAKTKRAWLAGRDAWREELALAWQAGVMTKLPHVWMAFAEKLPTLFADIDALLSELAYSPIHKKLSETRGR